MVHAWFLSDLHLKNLEERNSEILLRFLHLLNEEKIKITHLILLGDIFDLWVGGHKVFVNKWSPILDQLKKLKDQKNVSIIFIEGNHDVHIDPYWKNQLGAVVETEKYELMLGKKLVYLEHGDLINKNDKKYLKYRSMIRSWPLRFLGLNLPGVFWNYLGQKMSSASAQKSRIYRDDHQIKMKEMILDHGVNLIKTKIGVKAPDFIISGHFHVKVDEEIIINNQCSRVINLGSWMGTEKPAFYISNEQSGFQDITKLI